MQFIAIDPGAEQSAWVVYDSDQNRLGPSGILPNDDLLNILGAQHPFAAGIAHMAIEMVACYGMPVGKSIFDTVFWIGRFVQAFNGPHTLVYRRDIKLHLCNSARAKDANVRQALLDRFPATGGGKTPQIGVKSARGPLYGIKSHLWSALAVAVCWADTMQEIHPNTE